MAVDMRLERCRESEKWLECNNRIIEPLRAGEIKFTLENERRGRRGDEEKDIHISYNRFSHLLSSNLMPHLRYRVRA